MSATLRLTISIPAAMKGTSSYSPPAPGESSLTDTTCQVVFSPTSGITSIDAALGSLDDLTTTIPNTEAHTIDMALTLDVSYSKEPVTEAGSIAAVGGVYTSNRCLQQVKHTSI
jgi:hypothetical protein